MAPTWLHTLSILALLLGAGCAVGLAIDVARRPQHMAVMNLVWPICALFGTLAVVWAYLRYGRAAGHGDGAHHHGASHQDAAGKAAPPYPVMVGTGALHCGSGCVLGDILAEWLAFLVPGVAVWFGWGSLFSDKMFAVWVLDFLFAYAFGIAFQYFAIVPMRGLSFGPGLVAAVKADTLSLTAWQVGMYGFMALAQFVLFPPLIGGQAPVDAVEFWFAMQLAMVCGFVTSYPVNWWLIQVGIKEKM